MRASVVMCLVWIASVNSLRLPEFITPCKRSDPEINECAKINGNLAMPGLVKGNRKYQIPSMTPLHIPQINIDAGRSLKIRLTDNEVYGLEGTNVTSVDMQLDKNLMIFNVLIPRANIQGHYKMDGSILVLPINGEGKANITFMNGEYKYTMHFELIERKGKQYMSITDHSIVFTTTRAYYHFEHLFNGDGGLGEEMNKFINENWADVTQDLGGTVGETISSIITSIASNIFVKVPYDEVVPP